MKKLAIAMLLLAAPAYAQCPPGMSAGMCNAWEFHTTPQQRLMDQGIRPQSRAQQEWQESQRQFMNPHNRNNDPLPSNVPRWFQDYHSQRRQ